MKEKQIKTLPVINNSNQIKHEYECLCPNIECNQINGEDDLLCKRCEYDLTCTPLTKTSIQGKFGKDNPSSKAVLQFTLDNKFIKEFGSIAEAQRLTKVNNAHIVSVCKNKRNHAGGFKWQYKNI